MILNKRKLIIKRIVLISVTFLTGAAFFSLLTGACSIIGKADTWQINGTPKTEQSIDRIKFDNNVSEEDMFMEVYKNTDPKMFRLLWRDDFNGDKIDIKKWSCVSKTNNDNNELQAYMPENVTISEGILYLTADINPKNNRKKYSSGMIETLNKDEFLYGKIEIRASIPSGQGLFPAIWMLPETGNYYEIDILESIGNESFRVYGGNHFYYGGKRTKKFNSVIINDPQDFHIYSVEWLPDKIIWYADNKIFHQTTKGIPHENMYLIMNLAVGGNWPKDPDRSTVFPNSLKIDYVTVYEFIGDK